MPRDGSGIYTTPAGTTAVPDTTIESAKYNANVNDVAADLNAARPIVAGGTGANNAVDAANNLGVVTGKGAQTFTEAEKAVARNNIAAAPLDVLAYNGMQINGSFEVSQEIGTATQITNFKFICDGWSLGWLGSTNLFGTAAPVSWHPYTRNALVVGVTTAVPVLTSGDVAWIAHNIEGYRVSRLMWGTAQAMPITLAFWSSHTIPGTYTGTIRNLTPDRCYAFTYTQNVASTPEYKAITIPGCTDGTWNVTNGAGIYITFAIAAGVGANMAPSANTWLTGGYLAGPGQVNGVNSTSNFSALADVVVLPGTQAPTAAQSPLIMRPYDQELAMCKRYFEKCGSGWTGAWSSTTAAQVFGQFEVEKRTSPTLFLSPNDNIYMELMNITGSFTPPGVAVVSNSQVSPLGARVSLASLVATTATSQSPAGLSSNPLCFDARL